MELANGTSLFSVSLLTPTISRMTATFSFINFQSVSPSDFLTFVPSVEWNHAISLNGFPVNQASGCHFFFHIFLIVEIVRSARLQNRRF